MVRSNDVLLTALQLLYSSLDLLCCPASHTAPSLEDPSVFVFGSRSSSQFPAKGKKNTPSCNRFAARRISASSSGSSYPWKPSM